MPIPLGILAAAGSRPAATATFQLLESTVLTSSQANVEFANLTTKYASTYQHLQLRVVAQGTTGNANIFFTFNSDSANNYAWHSLFGQGSSVSSDSSVNRANIVGSIPVVASSNTDQYTASVIDILDPFETTKFKTTRSLSGRASSGGNIVQLDSGLYRSTSSIATITFGITTGQINAESRFSLYGIKATA
jgi:hypothetical protein